MPYRNIEKLQYIINEATGLPISYSDDEFVLPEMNDFLLKFDEYDENSFHCYFHEDCNISTQQRIVDSLDLACGDNGCTLIPEGNFTLTAHGPRLEVYIL